MSLKNCRYETEEGLSVEDGPTNEVYYDYHSIFNRYSSSTLKYTNTHQLETPD
jgi:hypothetical protein